MIFGGNIWRSYHHHHHHHHHNHNHHVLSVQGRSFTANLDTKAALLPKGRSSTANSGTKVSVLLGMNRCSSFPLLSAPHSLFSIWTDLRSSEKIQGTPAWRWAEWIWLTGPSVLNRNSSQGLNISSIKVFDQIRQPEIPITLRPRCTVDYRYLNHLPAPDLNLRLIFTLNSKPR